jgi:hypothetical protein
MITPVAQITGRRANVGRCSSLLFAAVLACVVLPACGHRKDASLCTAYGEFLDARAQLQEIDPTSLNASQATDLAQNALDGVRRLQEAADGRYGQSLFELEAAVNDVLLSLASIPDDADVATWGPLVEDDIATAGDAATVVEEAIEPSCTPDTSGD